MTKSFSKRLKRTFALGSVAVLALASVSIAGASESPSYSAAPIVAGVQVSAVDLAQAQEHGSGARWLP